MMKIINYITYVITAIFSFLLLSKLFKSKKEPITLRKVQIQDTKEEEKQLEQIQLKINEIEKKKEEPNVKPDFQKMDDSSIINHFNKTF